MNLVCPDMNTYTLPLAGNSLVLLRSQRVQSLLRKQHSSVKSCLKVLLGNIYPLHMLRGDICGLSQ